MSEKQQVNLYIDSDTVEKWDNTADKHDFSRADLIRIAVKQFRKHGFRSGGTGDSDGPTEIEATPSDAFDTSVENIEESMRELQGMVRALNRDIQIEQSVRRSEPEPVEQETVLEALPSQHYNMVPNPDGTGKVRENQPPSAFAPTAQDVADQLRADPEPVKEELDRLYNMGVINRALVGQDDSAPVYWRDSQ